MQKNEEHIKSTKIDNLPLNQIIKYENNSRKHSDQQVDRIANSISEFGFNQPIVIDEKNIILVGHGRFEAAKKLGLKAAPIVKLTGLTEVQKRSYRILDNKLQNDSEWNFEGLEIDLDFLKENDFDLESWGLDGLHDLFPKIEPEVTEDNFEGDLEKPTLIKRGDLIELNQHRVMCGDSTGEDLELLVNNKAPALFITDPPYGVDYASKNAFLNTIAPGNRIQDDIEGDAQTPTQMKEFWERAFSRANGVTSQEASYYIFGPQGGDLMMMMMSIKDAGWQLKHMLVWAKNNHVLGRCDYHYKHEPIWFGWKEKSKHYFYGGASQFSLWECDKPLASTLHPTMKPIALIAKAIQNSSKKDEGVLDSFLGSGTTLIAAEQLSRTCYGMEIEPKYCQVIVDRFQKYCTDNNKPCEIKINGEKI